MPIDVKASLENDLKISVLSKCAAVELLISIQLLNDKRDSMIVDLNAIIDIKTEVIDILEVDKRIVIEIVIVDEVKNVITMIKNVITTVIIVENVIVNIVIITKDQVAVIEVVMINITILTSMIEVNLETDCLQKIRVEAKIVLICVL